MSANESPKYIYADAKQNGGPHPHNDLDYNDFSLDPPYYYHRGHTAAVNRSSRIHHNPPLSHMDDASMSTVAEFPDYLPLDLQDPLEEGSSGIIRETSLPALSNPSSDAFGLWLSMVPSPELSLFTNERHTSSRGPPRSLLYPRGQSSYPSNLQESSRAPSPRAYLTPSSGGIADHISDPSSLPNPDVIPPGPISEHAYPAAMVARNSGYTQTSMAAFRGTAMDSNASSVLTDEGLSRHTNPHQPLSGYLDGLTEMPRNGHVYSLSYFGRQHEGGTSPDSRSGVQVNDPVIVTPPITSNQGTPVDGIPRNFRCRTCGVRFVQKQGLNRHQKDKHKRRETCLLCNSYTWSSGRRYLFFRHLEKDHPEAVLALAIGGPSDL